MTSRVARKLNIVRNGSISNKFFVMKRFPAPSGVPKAELFIYTLLWCHGVFYSCYCVYLFAKDNFKYLTPQDFRPGWKILKGPKDVSDYEWSVCSLMLVKLLPWFAVHIVCSNLLMKYKPSWRPLFGSSVSFICICHFIGVLGALFLLLQTLVIYAASLLKNKCVCWGTSLMFLIILNLSKSGGIQDLFVDSNSTEEYLLAVTVAWANARCLSFSLLQCDTQIDGNVGKKRRVDISLLLFYSFYLPVFFTGPLVTYEDFQREYYESVLSWKWRKVLRIFAGFLRYTFWMLFNDWVLHWFYFSALNFRPNLVSRLQLWPLCGLGFATSQFFMTKYVVLYGLPSVIADAEGFTLPTHPKCIARIHLYSDMWRHFDRGLYIFLKRFIYVPTVVSLGNGCRPTVRKLFAGALCFTFVWVWHGGSDSVGIWAMLNYVGIALENIARAFSASAVYQNFKQQWLSSAASVRLHAVVASPLLMMSAISNFFFLCGTEIGYIFVRRVLWEESWCSIFYILLYLYCFSHVSIAVKNWESKIPVCGKSDKVRDAS